VGAVPFAFSPAKGTVRSSLFAYDGDNLIEEANSSGAEVASYSQGLNIDEPLAMDRSSVASFYEADGLGSVTSLSSSAGALAETYTRDSFGRQTGSTGSLTNPFQYTGREFDTETSLYYYRARYYDPTVGRFIGEDPLRFSAGTNFYSYVRSNPVRFKDPMGLIRDCDEEQIECFRKCWARPCPWPFGTGSKNPKMNKGSKYRYCQSKCLAEYMECEAENEGKKLAEVCVEHPGACISIGVGVGIIIMFPESAPVVVPVIAKGST